MGSLPQCGNFEAVGGGRAVVSYVFYHLQCARPTPTHGTRIHCCYIFVQQQLCTRTGNDRLLVFEFLMWLTVCGCIAQMRTQLSTKFRLREDCSPKTQQFHFCFPYPLFPHPPPPRSPRLLHSLSYLTRRNTVRRARALSSCMDACHAAAPEDASASNCAQTHTHTYIYTHIHTTYSIQTYDTHTRTHAVERWCEMCFNNSAENNNFLYCSIRYR